MASEHKESTYFSPATLSVASQPSHKGADPKAITTSTPYLHPIPKPPSIASLHFLSLNPPPPFPFQPPPANPTTTTDAFHTLLAQNKTFASKTSQENPDLLARCAKGQSPPLLWLGCSDSRCPETTLLHAQPGDVFVHRNIANVLTPHDMSSQSVIYYAVNYLKVSHIVVAGHTSCGGVAAALGNGLVGGTMDAWLMPVRELRSELLAKGAFEGKGDKEKGLLLVEANVRKGVDVVRKNPEVLKAMEGRGVTVHGVVYDVGTGELRELETGEEDGDLKKRLENFKVG
ncbi:MAG: hypothetical protein L6R40_003668 [Gallowayella cf. fulva]|nr:MAG: hypothetical protein L6R40_003668 [Xanthomendoza cf. fulva]